jgi:diadenosine tetraphosphate (Ap4A) HIT family hydrolase
MTFQLDPHLAADSLPLTDWPLCTLRLMNDARYPWVLLIPRRNGLRELHELEPADTLQLWRESHRLSRALVAVFKGDKLNVAALGNMVPQLHVHHIVRHRQDDAWPAPVWGRHPARPYDTPTRQARIRTLQRALADTPPMT